MENRIHIKKFKRFKEREKEINIMSTTLLVAIGAGIAVLTGIGAGL